MINIEYFDDVGFFVNAVDDAVGSAARAVTAGQRAKEWLAYPARSKGQGSFTELKNRSRYGFREPLSDSPTRGGLEFDLVALRGHVPR